MPNVKGVKLSSACSGMRYKNRDDMFLVTMPEGTAVAGVFTTNTMPGIPIIWGKEIIAKGKAQALLVNAGYSNVFTGEKGRATLDKAVEKVAAKLGCDEEEVYIGSTGIIGEHIPEVPYIDAISDLIENTEESAWEAAAKAMMTTDTFAKGVTKTADINGAKVTINGITKGSGMIEPNMATMLCYVFTDACVSSNVLQHLLKEATDLSYNSITVDSDTSTSDMVLVFATNQTDHPEITNKNDPALAGFKEALTDVLKECAQLIVKDGEGISKFITVKVTGAKDDESARVIAKGIANSPLVKTAVAGEDPNWGRLVMGIGKTGEPADVNKIAIKFGDLLVAKEGARNDAYKEEDGIAYMKQDYIDMTVDVAVGKGEATVWTCDLTHEYISINADYRS